MRHFLHFISILLISFSFILKPCAQTVYQAEDANVISSGVVESTHLGFTGIGYVNGANSKGPYIEWAVSMATAGEQTLSFFYAHGKTDNRSMTLSVNGTEISDINFTSTGAWTTYFSKNVTTSLNEGLNIIRITASTVNGGPNIDKVEISGDKGPDFYELSINVQGEGSVIVNPKQDFYTIGTEVTLTAEPADTCFFAGWLGNITSADSIITVPIDTLNDITALFMRFNVITKTNKQIGWSTYETNTTGGDGGEVVNVSNQAELIAAVSGSAAKIVQILDSIQLNPVGLKIDVGSNKTIMGINKAVLFGGGFRVINANNVIFRNLIFKDAYVDWTGKTTDNDAIEINNSKHVWVTHCDFSHFDDGLCDIKNGSDYITVSWCHFHNHNKVMLIGAADGVAADVGHLNVTVHHNWFDGRFGNGMGQRLPFCRYGKIHVFNNYYSHNSVRGVEGNYDSDVVVDNNYFYDIIMPHVIVGGAGDVKMNASGNIYVESSDRRDKNGKAFDPSDYYSYEYSKAIDIPVIVMLGAGTDSDTLLGRIDSTFIGNPDISPLFNNTLKTGNTKLICYPNPSRDIIRISFSATGEGRVNVSMADMAGREVYFKELKNNSSAETNIELDVSEFASGTYILRLISSDGVLSEKIIVQ